MIEGHLDLLLGGSHELIEGAVPGLELLEVDPDLRLELVPIGNEPAAPAIAEEVSLQLGCPVCAHFVHYTSRRNRVPPRRDFRVEVQ